MDDSRRYHLMTEDELRRLGGPDWKFVLLIVASFIAGQIVFKAFFREMLFS